MVENEKDNRIKLVKLKENVGSALLSNIGIVEAIWEYITFIDSDDYWFLNKLEKQINFYKQMITNLYIEDMFI